MTAFTTLLNALFIPGKPITGATGSALRDNLYSVIEGDATAVAAGKTIADLAHPRFAIGAIELVNFSGLNLTVSGANFTNGGGSGTSGTVYESILDFVAMNAGTVRLSVDLRIGSGALTSILRVKKNGAVLGSVSHSNSTFTTYTFDFTFSLGDHIALESGMSYSLPSGSSGSAEYRNLKLLADKRGVFRI